MAFSVTYPLVSSSKVRWWCFQCQSIASKPYFLPNPYSPLELHLQGCRSSKWDALPSPRTPRRRSQPWLTSYYKGMRTAGCWTLLTSRRSGWISRGLHLRILRVRKPNSFVLIKKPNHTAWDQEILGSSLHAHYLFDLLPHFSSSYY